MIDKLDVRIPEFAAPGPVLAGPLEQLRKHPLPLFRPSRHYQYTCDLREPFDIDAVAHLFLRHGRKNHKVEIIDAGEKTLEEMVNIVTKLFDVTPWTLEVMRVDLAADVEGVPVHWFKDHAYVNRKQFSSRIEKSFEQEVQIVGMGRATAQTLYAGKRPNLLRIYNKLAEWRVQWLRIVSRCRRHNAGIDDFEMTDEQRYFGRLIPPTFQEYCRARDYEFKPSNVLTRIERQIGGRIPPEFATLGDLRHAHETNPFDGLRIVSGAWDNSFFPPPEGVPIRNFLAAVGYEWLKEQIGSEQLARQFVSQHANGNAKRILDCLAESLPPSRPAITLDDIHSSFRASTLPQTSKSEHCAVNLSPTYEHTK